MERNVDIKKKLVTGISRPLYHTSLSMAGGDGGAERLGMVEDLSLAELFLFFTCPTQAEGTEIMAKRFTNGNVLMPGNSQTMFDWPDPLVRKVQR